MTAATVSGSGALIGARRRSVPLVAVGVVLVLGCALAVAMWTSSASQRVGVLAAERDIPAGAVIAPADLRIVMVSVGSNVPTLGASMRDEVVGEVTTGAVPAGSLLSDAHLSPDGRVAEGEAVVAVRVGSGDLPSPDLRDGDFVSVVRVSSASEGTEPRTVATARVMRLELVDEVSGGETSVSLLVPRPVAAEIVDAAASDEVRLVLVAADQIGSSDTSDRSKASAGDGS